MTDRKSLRQQYGATRPTMGILQIRNLQNDRCYLVAAPDLKAAANSHRFRLDLGMHECKELQKEYAATGLELFTLDTLDILPYDEADPSKTDYSTELDALLALWEEKLTRQGVSLYRR
ncbi:MAG: GIY-YIG nuclease family protein [Sphaerochaetaceae bacterium]|nr:GIY-YIG nuclease family protein [Sphaerochaetaceae bacterium]